MGEIKNNAKLRGKVLNSIKIEDNCVIFDEINGEKITLFATNDEKTGLKNDAEISKYILHNPLGHELQLSGLNNELIMSWRVSCSYAEGDDGKAKILLTVDFTFARLIVYWISPLSSYIGLKMVTE